MKTSLRWRVVSICFLTLGSTIAGVAAPQPTAFSGTKLPISKIPPEPRAQMAMGAKTLTLTRLPLGANGTPLLLHAWRVDRRSPDSGEPALYCLDLFFRDKPNTGKWQLGYTTSYVSYVPYAPSVPVGYTVRWLHPATKKGLVIIENTPGPTGGTLRLITLPEGAPSASPSDRDPHYVQEFYPSSSGGINSVGFGVDASGIMVVQESRPVTVVPPGTPADHTWLVDTYAWTEGRWVKASSRYAKNSAG